MPDTYKAKDKSTGEIITFDWEGPKPPTDSDVRDVVVSRKKPKPFFESQKETKPITARIADIGERLFGTFPKPKELFTPEGEPIPSYEGEPTLHQIARAGAQAVLPLYSPGMALTALGTAGAGAIPGALGRIIPASVAGYFAQEMARSTPELVERAVEEPSAYNITQATIPPVIAGFAGYGGVKALTRRPPIIPQEEIPPPVEVPPPLAQPIQQQLLTPDVLRLKRPTPPLVRLPRQRAITPTEEQIPPEQLGLEFPERLSFRPSEAPPTIIQPKEIIPSEVSPVPLPRPSAISPVEFQEPQSFETGMVTSAGEVEPFRIIDRRRITPEMAEEIPLERPTRETTFDVTPEGRVIPRRIEPRVSEIKPLKLQPPTPIERAPEPLQLPGRTVLPQTAERIRRRMRQEEREQVPTEKPLSVLERLKQRKQEVTSKSIERRIEPEKRTNFDAWLEQKKNITHEQLMNLPSEEQTNIRGEYTHDTKWQMGLEKPLSVLERLKQKKSPEEIIKKAGGEYRGIQKSSTGPDLVMFDDPKTRSTLAIKTDEVTPEGVKRIIEESRAKFTKREIPGEEIRQRPRTISQARREVETQSKAIKGEIERRERHLGVPEGISERRQLPKLKEKTALQTTKEPTYDYLRDSKSGYIYQRNNLSGEITRSSVDHPIKSIAEAENFLDSMQRVPGVPVKPVDVPRTAKSILVEDLVTRTAEKVPRETKKSPILERLRSKAEDNYTSELGRLEIETRQQQPEISDVVPIAKLGKAAGKTWTEVTANLMEKGVKQKIANSAANRVFRSGEAGFLEITRREPKKIVQQVKQQTTSPEAKKVIDKTFNFTVIDEYARGPEFVVARMGKAGKELKTNLDFIEQGKASLAGDIKADYLKSELPKLNPEEFKSFHDVIEKGSNPLNDKVKRAYNDYVKYIDQRIVDESKAVGLKSLTVGGRKVPFREITIGRYFPRYATEAARQARDSLLSKIVAEKGVSYNKAWEIMNDKKSEYYVKAQRQRLLAESTDYEISKESIIKHIDDMSRQIAAAKVLGPDVMEGGKFNDLISRIAKESGADAEVTALNIARDFLIPEYQRIGKYSADINNALHTAASARYMTLFPISNLSGTIGLFTEGTTKGMARATAKYLPYLEKNIETARRSGSLEQLSRLEYAPTKNLISKPLGEAFDFSETHLRTFANEVGRESAIDRFTSLKKGGLSKRTTRLLREGLEKDLLENVDNVLKQSSLTEVQLRQAGFQMVKRTQGIISELSIPKVFRSQNLVIQQAMMFKRFAGIQTGNLIRAAKANPVRFAATVGIIAPILGEVVGDLMSTTRGVVAGLITDDTVRNAVEREVFEQRGKYYSQIVKNLGVDDTKEYDVPVYGKMTQAQIIGRLIDNLNRAFVLGLVGDFIIGIAESPEGLTRGKLPGVDILGEFTNDLIKLARVTNEDIDIGEAAKPLVKSLERSIPFAGAAVTRSKTEKESRVKGLIQQRRKRRPRRSR